MREISNIDDLRIIQMDILSYVDNICRQNNIKYSISGGTLLGAVRHKGFIPWDDDIDIMLTRAEYDRLINILQIEEKTINSRYRILTHQCDAEYAFPFAKVVDNMTELVELTTDSKAYGVFIDIFPIDNVPDQWSSFFISKMRILYNMLAVKKIVLDTRRSFVKNIIIKIFQILLLCLTSRFLILLMSKSAIRYNEISTSKRACVVWGYGRKEIMPSSLFESFIDIKFEDRTYMAVKNYNVYLSNLFGDYMTLPPIEKRVSHHDFVAYWK